ncbi:MAG: hypothetical protein OXG65_12010 [Chloroflexi bacterium]|nr:hypothetical protein [Chloroflexota bacterium]
MTVDPSVIPGLLLVAAEFLALAAVGYVVARVALQQRDDWMALAQGLVIGPALWGLAVSFVLPLLPGLAGAVGGWILVLALGIGLALSSRADLRLAPRTGAGFAAVALALFWVALASRQLLAIPDPHVHLELAAMVRAGAYPPTFPWLTEASVAYHYGADLFVALLTPPFGPDLAFVTELLGAYVWTSLVLVVATTLRQRASALVALSLTPLLLTAGAWTLVAIPEPPSILQIPAPTGVPAAGIRDSLAGIYWPTVQPLTLAMDASPPNIWKPLFALAYALTVVVLERAAARESPAWPSVLALAALVGFLGLVDETVVPIVLALWTLLALLALVDAWRRVRVSRDLVLRSAAGPALSALLLATSGSVFTDILFGSSESGLSFGWINDVGSRRPIGAVHLLPGGIALLGIGPVLAAVLAMLLAGRERLVVALSLGAGAFLLAAFTLQYAIAPHDIVRFDGHARNFALLALMIALAGRLSVWQPRRRYAASALIVVMVAWPTIAEPAREVATAFSEGIEVANAQPDTSPWGRHALATLESEPVAAYIRNHTTVDARVLSPHPDAMSLSTGRPNASGFAGYLHFRSTSGPRYTDAIRYLEPAAVRQLGYTYVHATEVWRASLPDRARHWLNDPRLFELLIRDGDDSLYRIRPGFLNLEPEPTPSSFEALRQAVPASALVYLAPAIKPLDSIRAASVLSHARILGTVHPPVLHVSTVIPTEPLDGRRPDVVVASLQLAPSSFEPQARQPIWWTSTMAVYAPGGGIAPLMPAPPRPFEVRLSDARSLNGRVRFTTTFVDRMPGGWTGQDWLLTATDTSPWAIPRDLHADLVTHKGVAWFAGQAVPGPATLTRTYEFDARAGRLAVQGADRQFTSVQSSAGQLHPGVWTLAVRLRHEDREVALIPVMKIVTPETGDSTYQVYEGALGAGPHT